MTNHKKYIRGYIGLLVLLIGVAIVAYLMMSQYESLGLVPPTDTTSSSGNTASETTSETTNPLERAQNAKNMLEARDRGIMSE